MYLLKNHPQTATNPVDKWTWSYDYW